jgi:HlyD family secretion protein
LDTRDADLSSLRIDRSGEKQGESGRGGPRKLFTFGIPLVLVIATTIAVLIGQIDAPVKVKVVAAEIQSPGQSEALLAASGYVVAERKAAVASKATGRLVYLGVVEGDKVKKGEVIARLEDNDVKAELAEAEANLELNDATLSDAKWNYDRDKDLMASGSITQSAYRTAETQYMKAKASVDVAKANVQAAEVAVENTLVRAPFDGTVLTKNADVGEIVAPMAGSINARGTVVTIADMSSLEVEPDVSESNIEKVSQGQPCVITLDAYPDVQYDGYVSKIIPTADRAKGTVTVKVAFNKYDGRVLPEMSAKVMFLGPKDGLNARALARVLEIPASSILARDGRKVVFKINDGKAVETPVTTGRTFGDFVEVKSGLKEGDLLIDSPSPKMTNGTRVAVEK